MESVEELNAAIKLYENQLEQINCALDSAGNDEVDELHLLKSNITELLDLTKRSLQAVNKDQNASTEDKDDDPLDKEYAMFKAELENLEENDNSESCTGQPTNDFDESDTVDIQEELNELIGSKCQAPYTDKLGINHYFNALVFSADAPHSASDLTQIQVRVMFINPTENEMIPCPFYLDGKCKFSDEKCNFSHGYMVAFSQLHEYKEPEFSNIKRGSHVLAKPSGKSLWVSTQIEEILSHDAVSIKHQGISITVPLHDIFPLTSTSQCNAYLSDGENQELEEEDDLIQEFGLVSDAALERSLLDPLGSNKRFGEWEQHTKGIGSKLMAKMGYVVGAGLGKCGEGRLDPVQAVILPPGKSLDHCMNLREAAGGSKDLFTVERLQKKIALKAQRKSAQLYRKKKKEEQHNVFNIINNIAQVPKKSEEDFSSRKFKKKLESSSERTLNVEKLKTEETMNRISREIYILSDKLSMKKEGSSEYKHIFTKLSAAKLELESLQKKNGKIDWEINVRDTKKKMAF